MNFKNYFFDKLLIEEKIESKSWYHGSPVKFEKFDLDYVYIKDKSNAELGPGFYLTDNIDLAKRYSTRGGYLYTVQLKRKTYIKNANSKPYSLMAQKFVKDMPDRETVLSNWDENPFVAENKLISSLNQYNDTLIEMIQSIWTDCYNGYEKELCTRLFKKSEIEGIITFGQPDYDNKPVNILVAYNPDILKIINIEQL